MTERKGKSGTIDVKALLAGDEEFLRALVRTALAGSFAAEPAVLERVGSPERSFPRGFAWLAARFGRFDLLEGLDVEPSELVPPAFPLGFIEHTIQAPRSMPWRAPTS